MPTYLGDSAALRARWADLPLSRQRAIVAAVLDRAIVAPAVRGRTAFDPARVTPVWRADRSLAGTHRLATTLPSPTFTGTPCAAQDASTHARTASGELHAPLRPHGRRPPQSSTDEECHSRAGGRPMRIAARSSASRAVAPRTATRSGWKPWATSYRWSPAASRPESFPTYLAR